MNTFAPVSAIMTTKLQTVNPEDSLLMVKDVFENNRFHHIPVVRYKKIVGMVSRLDFEHFLNGMSHGEADSFLNNKRLEHTKVEDIMTKGLAKIEPTDRINVALDLFAKNIFHALPVVDNDELVGIVTTHDIIRTLAEEKPLHPEDVYTNEL